MKAPGPEVPSEGGLADLMARADEGWDLVLLVEYPTRGVFLKMIGSPEYAAIAHLRTEALARGELHPLDAAPG